MNANCVHAQLLSHIQLCNSIRYSLRDSSVHGIIQVRILEWVAIFSSTGSSQSRDQIPVPCVSCIGSDSLPLSHLESP